MPNPIVTITDSFDAIVDGQNWGKFGDVVVNNKGNAELLVAVNLAVMAKAAAIKTAADSAVSAANTAKSAAETRATEINATLETIRTDLAAPKPDFSAIAAKAAAALMTEDEKKAAQLQAVIDDATAKLAALPVSKVGAPIKVQ